MAWNIFETFGRIKNNLTPKMIIIWAVCFVGLISITGGTIVTVTYLIPREHGIKINNSNVFMMEYRNSLSANEIKTTELFNQTIIQHEAPRKKILRELTNGGKTNLFEDFFRGMPTQTLIEANNTDTTYTSIFSNTFAENSLVIWFAKPQYNVGKSTTKLNHGIDQRNQNNVYGLFIPLDKTSDRFQEQIWYIATMNQYGKDNYYSIALPYKITTHGNYSKLWNFIKDYPLYV